jgi:hypothetical protein
MTDYWSPTPHIASCSGRSDHVGASDEGVTACILAKEPTDPLPAFQGVRELVLALTPNPGAPVQTPLGGVLQSPGENMIG